MAVNATELVSKLNFVMSSRRLKTKGYIEDYPMLPKTPGEEEDAVAELMFSFIKKLFVGCKVRANANSYSLRLDGQIHRKANKLREIYANDSEWRQWFEANHNSLFRTMRDNRQTFQNGSYCERRKVDDKIFLYIPKKPNRIYGYVNHGLVETCQWLEGEHRRDTNLANIYEQVTTLMENEIKRREEERRARIARELQQYKEQILQRLFKPVAPMQESEKALDRLFAHKFSEWARENGKAPEYAIPAGPQQLVTTGLRVKIMAPPGSEEEGWVALPPFEGYPEPEGYEMQGWGKVTNIDMTSDRSRRGAAPIVVQEYLYTEFKEEFWNHLLPANYAEILEVSNRIWAEAEVEIEPWLEQERIRKEAEEAEARAAEEARQRQLEEERQIREAEIRRQLEERRAQREAEERRVAQAVEQMQRQLEETARREQMEAEARAEHQAAEDRVVEEVVEAPQWRPAGNPFVEYAQLRPDAPDIDLDEPTQAPNQALLDALRNQFNAEPERATESGLYRNMRAIPLERYVAINAAGTTRRFASAQRAAQFLGLTGAVTIRDYHVPHNEVEGIVVENDDELPF